MTLPMMIYGLVLGLLVAAAAHFLDRGFRGVGKPTRWVWVGALLTGVLAPLLPMLLPAGTPEAVGGSLGLPVAILYEAGTFAAATPTGSWMAIPTFETVVGVLWLVGTAAVLLFLAAGGLRLHSQRRSWEACRVGGQDVLLSNGVGPAVTGLIRPVIVLLRWVLSLPKEELDLVILHEREHREARDPTFLTVGLLLVALSPWNPVLWWAFLRLRLAVDGDCDARVLARGISPKHYAELLLDFVARRGRAHILIPAMADGRGTNLEKRLVMIRSSLGKHRAWASAVAAAAALALVVVACETPLPQESVEAAQSLAAAEGAAPSRLATGVESGWITQEQADLIAERLQRLAGQLRAGVSEGRMTEEDARGRYFAAELDTFGAVIGGRHRAGEMTREEAGAAMEGYQALMGEAARLADMARDSDRSIDREQLAAITATLDSLVAAGEITQEQADARWNAVMERVRADRGGSTGR